MSYVLLFYDFKDELGKKVETIFFFHPSCSLFCQLGSPATEVVV